MWPTSKWATGWSITGCRGRLRDAPQCAGGEDDQDPRLREGRGCGSGVPEGAHRLDARPSRSDGWSPARPSWCWAAAGGVGSILVPWANALGARSDRRGVDAGEGETGAGIRLLGDRSLASEDVPARVKELNGGKGVPVVYDSVGKTSAEQSLKSLAAARVVHHLWQCVRTGRSDPAGAAQSGRVADHDAAGPVPLHAQAGRSRARLGGAVGRDAIGRGEGGCAPALCAEGCGRCAPGARRRARPAARRSCWALRRERETNKTPGPSFQQWVDNGAAYVTGVANGCWASLPSLAIWIAWTMSLMLARSRVGLVSANELAAVFGLSR